MSVLGLLLSLTALLAPASPATAGDQPATAGPTPAATSCYGAAAHDPDAPCHDPALDRQVEPYPDVSAARAAQGGSPCQRIESDGPIAACWTGAAPKRAVRTVAVVGSSHAGHWRPAIEYAASRLGWRLVTIVHAGCPMSMALPRMERWTSCIRWNLAIPGFLAKHPEIDLLITSNHRGRVVVPEGQTEDQARGEGYRLMWDRILTTTSVKRILVIRDTPRFRTATIPCVRDALDRGLIPAEACALERDWALPPDPTANTARALGDPRVQVMNLTRFFCDDTTCPPVIGGVLTLRDVSHVTTRFAETLGPYMLGVLQERLRAG